MALVTPRLSGARLSAQLVLVVGKYKCTYYVSSSCMKFELKYDSTWG